MDIILESFVDVFKSNKTGVSFYDDIIDPKETEYMKFQKGIVGRLEKMTADEYIRRCAEDVFGCSVEKAKKGLNQESILKYAQMMKDGVKFNLPYLNLHPYFGPSQEGRHRMIAMAQAFGEDAEGYVLIVEPYEPDEKEINDYCQKSSDPEWRRHIVDSCLDKYLERDSKEVFQEDRFKTVSAIDLNEGDIIDLGDGWATITQYDLSKRMIEIEATLLDSGHEVDYSVDDFDKVKLKI